MNPPSVVTPQNKPKNYSWMCNKCQFSNVFSDADDQILKCTKCNFFVTSLDVIRNQFLLTIVNNNNLKDFDKDKVNPLLNVLKLFKIDQFVKYHSTKNLENVLLFAINLVIEYNINTVTAKFIIESVVNNQVLLNRFQFAKKKTKTLEKPTASTLILAQDCKIQPKKERLIALFVRLTLILQ